MMAEHQFTPGPWKITRSAKGRWEVVDDAAVCTEHMPITDAEGRAVAFAVASSKQYFRGDRVTGNARLIMASPDLLTAAIELVAASDAYEGDPGDDERCRHAIDDLRAAISRATGEAA